MDKLHDKIKELQPTLDTLEDLVILEHPRIGMIAIGMDGNNVDYATVIKTPKELEDIVNQELGFINER